MSLEVYRRAKFEKRVVQTREGQKLIITVYPTAQEAAMAVAQGGRLVTYDNESFNK